MRDWYVVGKLLLCAGVAFAVYYQLIIETGQLSALLISTLATMALLAWRRVREAEQAVQALQMQVMTLNGLSHRHLPDGTRKGITH